MAVEYKPKKPVWLDWLETLIFAFVAASLIKYYAFQTYKIPSSSMEKTLLVGDFLIANKFVYNFTAPDYGDIIIFQHPMDADYPSPREDYVRIAGPVFWNKKTWRPHYYLPKSLVKRLIGKPGDTIEIRNKQVYRNGEALVEPYKQHVRSQVLPARYDIAQRVPREHRPEYWYGKKLGSEDNFGPITVPSGMYFGMGDNRDNSSDSRFWGYIPEDSVMGSPLVIYWSWDGPGHIRFDRLFKFLF